MGIVKLTRDDFTGTFLKTHPKKKVMIFFKAEWCGYCNKFKPDYERLAQSSGDTMFATVDADEQKELLQDINSFLYGYNVQGYPTLVLYENGYYKSTYAGQRTYDDIQKALQ